MTDYRNDAPIDILLVEDNPGDVRLTREAFEEGQINNTLHVVNDGEAALDFLYRRGDYVDAPSPDLVLLDLNLPKMDGMEVLKEVKDDPGLKRIPIVILTGSDAQEDVVQGYERHSAAYLTKPVDPDDFIELVQTFENFWISLAKLPPAPEQ